MRKDGCFWKKLEAFVKTVLAIISSPKDNSLIARHWPFFILTGWEILGCGTEDGRCEWPEPVMRLDTGRYGTHQTPAGSAIFGLLQQELDIWKWFLDESEYDSVCVVEADNLFVRTPPEHPGSELYVVTALPNYERAGLFNTPVYFSTPRWAGRHAARRLYEHGQEMLSRGDTQNWMSDRWPAHICHQHKIPWIAQPGWSQFSYVWGAETWQEAWLRDARAAIKLGCYVLHSCKHLWQLQALADLIPIL